MFTLSMIKIQKLPIVLKHELPMKLCSTILDMHFQHNETFKYHLSSRPLELPGKRCCESFPFKIAKNCMHRTHFFQDAIL